MTTYIVVKNKGALKGAVVASKSMTIQTPKTPKKAPTTGLIWPPT